MAHAWVLSPSGWGWRCSTLRQRPKEALHKPCCRSSHCGLPLKEYHSRQLHKRGSLHVAAALFTPPTFSAAKLSVSFLPNSSSQQVANRARCYTLTHNDLTGQLHLTIGDRYNEQQLAGWYSRLLRDEVLAYWQFDGNQGPELHVECHVSGEESWLAPPALRDYIFRREMPLVLDVINSAERALFEQQPELGDAQVFVHLTSHVERLHATVLWGCLSDRSSWLQSPVFWRRQDPTPASASAAPSAALAPTPPGPGGTGFLRAQQQAQRQQNGNGGPVVEQLPAQAGRGDDSGPGRASPSLTTDPSSETLDSRSLCDDEASWHVSITDRQTQHWHVEAALIACCRDNSVQWLARPGGQAAVAVCGLQAYTGLIHLLWRILQHDWTTYNASNERTALRQPPPSQSYEPPFF